MARNGSGLLSSGIIPILVLILLVGAFFTPGIESHWLSPVLSSILAIASLTCICISLYYINGSFFLISGNSLALPALYLLLVLSYPQAVYFSYYHIAALLFLWGYYFNIIFIVEREKQMSSLFLSTLILSSIVLIIPQFIWIIAALWIFDIVYSKMNFFRYTAIYLAAFLIPFIYYFSINYLFFDLDFVSVLTEFSSALTNVSIAFEPMTVSHIFMVGMIAIVVIRSVLFLFSHRREFNATSSRSYSRGALMTFLILLLDLLYFSSIDHSIQIIFFIPISVIIFAFFNNVEKKTRANVLLILLLLSIIVGRISYFL